jgi:hypothetical protein
MGKEKGGKREDEVKGERKGRRDEGKGGGGWKEGGWGRALSGVNDAACVWAT